MDNTPGSLEGQCPAVSASGIRCKPPGLQYQFFSAQLATLRVCSDGLQKQSALAPTWVAGSRYGRGESQSSSSCFQMDKTPFRDGIKPRKVRNGWWDGLRNGSHHRIFSAPVHSPHQTKLFLACHKPLQLALCQYVCQFLASRGAWAAIRLKLSAASARPTAFLCMP